LAPSLNVAVFGPKAYYGPATQDGWISSMVRWRDIELPGCDRPLTLVEPARRQALATHLEAVVADASFAAIDRPDGTSAAQSSPDFLSACSACRGHCCQKGGNDAYLDFESVGLAWGRFPHLTKQELVSAYLDAVPARSFADSCIFHAEHGCNLPQTMRSPVCGAYLCGPLLALKTSLSPQPPAASGRARGRRPMVNRALT
jgi:hypothetical protein